MKEKTLAFLIGLQTASFTVNKICFPLPSPDSYYVAYKPLKTSEQLKVETVKFSTNNDREIVLHNLKRASKYVITLQAFNGKGTGPASDEVIGETTELDAPAKPKLKIFAFDSSTVTLEWSGDIENPIQGKSSL